MSTITIEKNGNIIHSVEDWFRFAPPARGEKQWKDGRSAKELAKAWFPIDGEPQVPMELSSLFFNNDATRGIRIERGFPECEIHLDRFNGPRNADLVVIGPKSGVNIAVNIEAKERETFGDPIQTCLNRVKDRSTNLPERINNLCLAIFNLQISQIPGIGTIRYQLLHGTAAALIEAKNQKANLALFVVHEFRSERTPKRNLEINADDFKKFIWLVTKDENTKINEGSLIGPIIIPGNEIIPNNIPLYIGKIIRHLPY
jgi:hypothetical protein